MFLFSVLLLFYELSDHNSVHSCRVIVSLLLFIPVSLFITVSLLRKTLTDQICRYIDVSQYSLIFKLVRLYFIFSPGNSFIKATCDRFKACSALKAG